MEHAQIRKQVENYDHSEEILWDGDVEMKEATAPSKNEKELNSEESFLSVMNAVGRMVLAGTSLDILRDNIMGDANGPKNAVGLIGMWTLNFMKNCIRCNEGKPATMAQKWACGIGMAEKAMAAQMMASFFKMRRDNELFCGEPHPESEKVEVCFLDGWFILPDGAARCT